jgi:cellobiose PTS system EIIB component
MEKKLILLVCGGGMSSGFLANNIRKAARKRNLDIEVIARGESEVGAYLDQMNALLMGPHLKYMEKEFRAKLDPKGIPLAVIDQLTYGTLDGEKALDLILSII